MESPEETETDTFLPDPAPSAPSLPTTPEPLPEPTPPSPPVEVELENTEAEIEDRSYGCCYGTCCTLRTSATVLISIELICFFLFTMLELTYNEVLPFPSWWKKYFLSTLIIGTALSAIIIALISNGVSAKRPSLIIFQVLFQVLVLVWYSSLTVLHLAEGVESVRRNMSIVDFMDQYFDIYFTLFFLFVLRIIAFVKGILCYSFLRRNIAMQRKAVATFYC